MGAAVAAAAAATARARRELLEHFRLAGATRPETAISLPDVRPPARRQFARWQREGVMREAPGGGYWLDEAAYAAADAARRRRAQIALLVVLVLAAVFTFLVQQTTRPS